MISKRENDIFAKIGDCPRQNGHKRSFYFNKYLKTGLLITYFHSGAVDQINIKFLGTMKEIVKGPVGPYLSANVKELYIKAIKMCENHDRDKEK
jgi:hypothetical protein